MARSNGRSCHPTTVAIWVDELLWGLSLVIPQLAGGFVNLAQDREELARRPQSIRDQIRNDGLRSVVQLPGTTYILHLQLPTTTHKYPDRALDRCTPRLGLMQSFTSFQTCCFITAIRLLCYASTLDHARASKVDVCHAKMLDDVVDISSCIFSTEASNILASLHDAATHIHATPHNGVSCVDLSSKRLAAALLVGLFAVIRNGRYRDCFSLNIHRSFPYITRRIETQNRLICCPSVLAACSTSLSLF